MFVGLVMLGRWKNIRRESSPFQVEITIAKLRRYKSPDIDQISAELIEREGEILRSEIHTLITSVRN
jgi:hypothetical protein